MIEFERLAWLRGAILVALCTLPACGDGRRLGGKYDSAPAAAGTSSSTAGTAGQGGSAFAPDGGSTSHSGGSNSSAGSGGSAGTPEPPQCDGVTSFGAESFAIERGPSALAIGDIDGDGPPDLVVGGLAGISVLSAKNGALEELTRIATAPRVWELTLGDLNGDDKLDLFITNDHPKLTVLIGNGDGTFLDAQDYALSDSPTIAVAGDLNGDQMLDLATVSDHDVTGATLEVLLGNGDGTLQAARAEPIREVALAYSEGSFLAVGDLNGDDRLDLVTIEYESVSEDRLSVLLGNGDGTFQHVLDVAAFQEAGAFVLVDLDGDDELDVAVASVDANEQGVVAVLLGKGDGTFQTPRTFSAGTARSGTHRLYLTAADVNSDGTLDVVNVDNRVDYFANANVLLGNGDGTLQNFQPFLIGSNPGALAVGDLNGDDKPDVAAADHHASSVGVLYGNGDGTLRGGRNLPFQEEAAYCSSCYYSLGIADFNADRTLDLIAGLATEESAVLMLGNGDGTFERTRISVASNGAQPTAVGDVDGDGNVDVATGRPSEPSRILLGNGDGSFQAARQVGGTGRVTTMIDLNGDGLLDLVRDWNCDVLLGKGDGSFESAKALALDHCALVAFGDLNGDGTPDLARSGWDPDTLQALMGNGDGTFGPPFELAAAGGDVAIADLDGDGSSDVILSNQATGNVDVFRGNGDGTFQSPQSFDDGGGRPAYSAVGDLNLDGKLDLALAIIDPEHVGVRVLFGDGKGGFGAPRRFAATLNAGEISIGDANGDMQPDLIVQAPSTINLLYGRRECR